MRQRRRESGDCSYPRVLPVNIDAIEVVVFDEIGDVGGHGQTVGGSDAFPKNHVSAWVGGKCPAANGKNAFCALDLSEQVELVGGCFVRNLDLIGRR